MERSLYVVWFFGEVLLLCTLIGIARLALPAGRPLKEWREAAAILALGLVAVVATPAGVAEFRISPDSLEYVAGARSLVESGRFELPYGLPAFTPRYPPWFSALWISPVLSTGAELGLSIIPVTLSALLALLCAFRVGAVIGGAWGGTASALAILLVPGFVFFSRQVLIDIPTTLFVLGGGLVYLRMRETETPRWGIVFLGGLIAGNAALLRPTGLFIALPLGLALLRSSLRRLDLWMLFVTPILTALGAGAVYNYHTFGEALRSGYNLWCGIPYDFTSLTFGVRYVGENARAIFVDSGLGALLVFLVVGLVALRRSVQWNYRPLKEMSAFTAAVGIPLTLFYLLYFFPSVRFIVPVSAILAVLLGGLVGSLLESRGGRQDGRAMLVLLSIVVVGGYRLSVHELPPVKGESARKIREHTPAGSLVISGIDPVYLALTVGPTREYLPVSRRVEYASKFLTDARLTIDPSDVEPRCENPDPRLLEHGARHAVPRVALDDLDYIASALQSGRPVFFDTTRVKPEERDRLEERFRVTERVPNLFEVQR